MEQMKVVGFRTVDFEDDKGKRISGISLYVIHPEDGVQGCMAEKVFLSSDRLSELHYRPVIDEVISVGYGRRGRIASVEVCKK